MCAACHKPSSATAQFSSAHLTTHAASMGRQQMCQVRAVGVGAWSLANGFSCVLISSTLRCSAALAVPFSPFKYISAVLCFLLFVDFFLCFFLYLCYTVYCFLLAAAWAGSVGRQSGADRGGEGRLLPAPWALEQHIHTWPHWLSDSSVGRTTASGRGPRPGQTFKLTWPKGWQLGRGIYFKNFKVWQHFRNISQCVDVWVYFYVCACVCAYLCVPNWWLAVWPNGNESFVVKNYAHTVYMDRYIYLDLSPSWV